MDIRVMTWNIAGAKLLEYLDSPDTAVASSYITSYQNVWEEGIRHYCAIAPNEPILPDIIFLQECIGFINHSDNPSERWYSGKRILEEIFNDYDCYFFPAFSSHKNPHPKRWKKYDMEGEFDNYLPSYIEAQQGYGVCIKKQSENNKTNVGLRKIWVPIKEQKVMREGDDIPEDDEHHLCFEAIRTTSSLYLGDRNTEPRYAIMGRAKLEILKEQEPNEIRYVNFINLHLTTLNGERLGNIKINRMASELRVRQLDIILNDVISAYQEADTFRLLRETNQRKEDIWIVGGDFNAIEDSEEILLMKRMGFVDGHDGHEKKKLTDATESKRYHGKIGTKWSVKRRSLPPVPVDFIFCGLERNSFGEEECNRSESLRPLRPKFENEVFESDHAVLIASFKL